jgi:cytidylate kinase
MQTPSTTVLAISRQLGAGGSYVGQAVARRLGLNYADREILEEAARHLGREHASLEPLEERVAGLWERMTRHLSFGPPDALFTPPSPASTVYEEDLFRIERQVILEMANRENCVIVGRASPYILRDHPGVIRLFLHAPAAWRAGTLERLGRQKGQDTMELIRKTDRERARFVQMVGGYEWGNACKYDLTLNPAAIGLEEVVDIVAKVVESRLREPRRVRD